jgi:hypothetical protein
MSTQYRLVQSGKTASGGCSAGQGSIEPVAPRIYCLLFKITKGTMALYWPGTLLCWPRAENIVICVAEVSTVFTVFVIILLLFPGYSPTRITLKYLIKLNP